MPQRGCKNIRVVKGEGKGQAQLGVPLFVISVLVATPAEGYCGKLSFCMKL